MAKNLQPKRENFQNEDQYLIALLQYSQIVLNQTASMLQGNQSELKNLLSAQSRQNLLSAMTYNQATIDILSKQSAHTLNKRATLIGATKRAIKSFYKGEPISFLQCELILWQESEQYEICQAIKEMIEK